MNPSPLTDPLERARRDAKRMNAVPGHLTGYDCPTCLNRGVIYSVDADGYISARDCGCMAVRRSLALIERSGLGDTLARCTFDTWESSERWQATLVDMLRQWAERPQGWLYLSGRPGTGKTHLCTAVCGELLRRGIPVRYLRWRDFSVEAKALIGDAQAYQRAVEPAKTVQVLYLDDFFKGGSAPTAGDVNLAFEIINARYSDRGFLTIFSSERTLNDLLDIDEALGSRIRERTGNGYFDLHDKVNWRLRR